MAALKLGSGLGLFLAVILVAFVLVKVFVPSSHAVPQWKGASAKLPCLANDHCPMGQKCTTGFCSETFSVPVQRPAVDTASCNSKECSGVNAPCARSATPCAEGTFCQNNQCVSIASPDQGEAYKHIGLLL